MSKAGAACSGETRDGEDSHAAIKLRNRKLVFLRKLNAGHAHIAIEHAYGNRFEALSRAFALYACSGGRIEERAVFTADDALHGRVQM